MEKKYFNKEYPTLLHGADYNPEQWVDTKEVWDEDMRLMKLANCNEMSVGIFSWSVLEPRENEYHFEIFDEILDKIYRNGGRVLLATPSGARPRWMAEKYPEVLRTNERGEKMLYGARHNHCLTSPYYRKKVREMNSLLAERYGKHPAVIGWHISNEYSGECFCPLCRDAFHKFLAKKYGNIDKLNFEWWNTFWSHRFSSFEQIDPPSPLGDSYSALYLDWQRFVTEQTASFLKNEVEAVRTHSNLPTTANFMQHYTQLNYWVMEKEIDAVSWDSYPDWHNDAVMDLPHTAADTAFVHDTYRAMKQKPFLLMESTPSLVNWRKYNKLKRPGIHKLASIQAVAHGSDSVQYFQWRKSRGSCEKFHGAVIDHNPTENTRVFREVREVGELIKKICCCAGTMPKVEVAVIFDTENEWALSKAQGFCRNNKKYYDTCFGFYFSMWKRGIAVDIIDANRPIDSYKLVIAPMLYMMKESTISRLVDYVKGGGTLVSTYMTGMVNENDLCYLNGIPASELSDVFGLVSEEIDTLYPQDSNFTVYKGEKYPLHEYCERIHTKGGAEVLARYGCDFYANEPMLVKNRYGEGTAYYFAARDTGELSDKIMSEISDELSLSRDFENLPYGVTSHSRECDGEKYVFVENYNDSPVTVESSIEMLDLETNEKVFGRVELKPYGIRVFLVKG